MDALEEAFQHHTWATEKLIGHLAELPPEALTATGAGVYGDPISTLSHLLAADNRYLANLEGVQLPPRQPGLDKVATLEELGDAIRDQAVRWRALLPRLAGIDFTMPARGSRPEWPHATNMVVVQALHHGNDHRTQVCSVLSANGYETPDLDVWTYWAERRAEPVG
jgi:uncharacterized damage-inducible protein DinB